MHSECYSLIGGFFILHAIFEFPLVGQAFGHINPYSTVLGVAPCPTIVFTFGLLLSTEGKAPYWHMIISGFRALIGFSATVQFTNYEDMDLIITGSTCTIVLVYLNCKEVRIHAFNMLSS